jgi:hypothetical protein
MASKGDKSEVNERAPFYLRDNSTAPLSHLIVPDTFFLTSDSDPGFASI